MGGREGVKDEKEKMRERERWWEGGLGERFVYRGNHVWGM